MEFIGISGKSKKVDIERLTEIAESQGIYTVKNKWNYDSEVYPGVNFFISSIEDDFLLQLVLRRKGAKRTTTSNLLTEELNDYFINKTKSTFIDFITALSKSDLQLKGIHIIFASEWEDESQNIRLIKTDLEGVLNYFKSNNSWHLVFYNIVRKSYEYEFGCPLVFEID